MEYTYTHTVHYYETDKMQCVHHSNYIRWFEEARTFFMKEKGFAYDQMENMGITIPVVQVQVEYKSMTRFGETVEIVTTIQSYDGVRLHFEYTVRDKDTGVIRCQGATLHCFLGERGKPISLKKHHPQLDQKIREAFAKS